MAQADLWVGDSRVAGPEESALLLWTSVSPVGQAMGDRLSIGLMGLPPSNALVHLSSCDLSVRPSAPADCQGSVRELKALPGEVDHPGGSLPQSPSAVGRVWVTVSTPTSIRDHA